MAIDAVIIFRIFIVDLFSNLPLLLLKHIKMSIPPLPSIDASLLLLDCTGKQGLVANVSIRNFVNNQNRY